MRIFRAGLIFGLLALASPALADLTYTQGVGTTIFDFTCFTTKHCVPHVNITSAGVEIFTSAAPGQVTGANGTFPVTGTVTANIGTAGTLATAAKQPALGTAGSASTDVITVQGITSMTALKVDGSAVTQPVSGTVTANAGTNLNTSALALDTTLQGLLLSLGSTTSGQKGSLTLAAVTTSSPSYTNGQTNSLSLDTAGSLRINCITGCSSSGGSSLTDAGTFTQATTAFTVAGGIFNNSITNLTSGQAGAFQSTNDRMLFVNLGKIAGTVTDTNSGTKSAGTLRTVIATDQPALTNAQPGNFTQLGGTTVDVNMGAPSGGTQRVSQSSVTKKRLSALSTTVTAIKSSAAGQLVMLQCGNTNASQAYLQVFDVATAGGVTLGTTAPDLSIPIPATNSEGFVIPGGLAFANGIQVAATTTATGSSALGTALDCNAAYN